VNTFTEDILLTFHKNWQPQTQKCRSWRASARRTIFFKNQHSHIPENTERAVMH